MSFQILGVHPVDTAKEPCHLIEVLVSAGADVDWGQVTQEVAGQPSLNWQAPWDEQSIGDSAERWCFFFHYLDPNKPLLTPLGPIALVKESPVPDHLKHIQYEPPC